MEDEYKVVCALSNSAGFDDLEWPQTQVSKSQYSLKSNISQTVHAMAKYISALCVYDGYRPTVSEDKIHYIFKGHERRAVPQQ